MSLLLKLKSLIAISSILLATVFCLGLTLDWAKIRGRHMNSFLVYELGYFGYMAYDTIQAVSNLISSTDLLGDDLPEYQSFLKERNSESKSSLETGIRSKNVIYIQYESVDGISAEGTFRGKEIMPFFNELINEGLYFRNASDNTLHGRTTDGEFLALASLPPLRTAPVYTKFDLSSVPSLPRIFKEHGYRSLSIHGFEGRFWKRKRAHNSLGFDDSLFIDDLDTSETIGWGISDKSILQQAIDLIETLPEPFFLHIILLTNHHPYDHLRTKLGRGEQSIVEDYVDSVRYVDDSVRTFFESIRTSPRFERSIIALFGDHDSGITPKLQQSFAYPSDAILSDTVPMLILGTDHSPQRFTKAAGVQDIPVIILRDLGISPPITFIGNPADSNAPNIHPGAGYQFITTNLELSQTPAAIDLNKLTKLAVLHPEALTGEEK